MREANVRLNLAENRQKREREPTKLETLESGDDSTTLIRGDNLKAMQALEPRYAETFTLAYLDPPFLTGKQHTRVTRRRDTKSGKILRASTPAFDDRWGSLREYLVTLGARLEAARALLADHGCLIVHIDSKTSHYIKVLCDEIFGQRAFASEIIWRYRRWPAKTVNFQRVHDVLLRYQKNPDSAPRFNQLYEPLSASTLATWGDRKQRAVMGQDGRRERSSRTSEPTPGTPLGDVWDIGIVAPVSRERTGYPTQKPEALLQRVLESCSNPGDWILDPYAGSGTSLAVARRLGRRAVGIDNSPEAFHVTRQRLLDAGITPRIDRVVSKTESSTPSRVVRKAS
jgi:adenine specific DNA methylase Mod